MLIPGRPVREVAVYESDEDTIDFSIFTLSTVPIQKLHLSYFALYPTPGSHLASIFPSLEHLVIDIRGRNWGVRIAPLYLSV